MGNGGVVSAGNKEAVGMNTETTLMHEIMVALSSRCRIFRINVGTFKTADGRWITTGVPAGFSDLFGIRNGDGKAVFIEVKTKRGKATDAQLKFIEAMRNRGALAGIARSVQDALEIVEGAE